MYTPLKITTDYTLLKSLIKIDDLIKFLLEKQVNACAICDENLSSSLEFYQKCRKNNIKPIIGLCVSINNLDIYLYAKNYLGYKNLIRINTIKQERELVFIDLEKYSNDLVVILPYQSRELINNFKRYDLFLGYKTLYEKKNAQVLHEKIVYVNDIRALRLKDVDYLKYLDLIAQKEVGHYEENYYRSESFIDEEEINLFVKKFNFEIPEGQRYIPSYNNDIDTYQFLASLAYRGLEKRLNKKVPLKYQERLKYELDIIKKMDFVDYFLIVYDYVLYAKKNNILVGPGRGSAAGSLVSYCIGITDIDPIKYDLLFERFLNIDRVTMPDIDIDFDAEKRDQVIDYVKNKYGYTKVAGGITFSTLKSKLVLREIGKALKINNELLEKFLRNISSGATLKENLNNEIVKKYLNNYKELNNLYEIAFKLEGLKKNISTHAAGVVISSVELDEVIPIHYQNNILLTGVPMDYLEGIGLLKMDFLGIKNLTIIANILDKVGHQVLKNINLEDEEVFNIFRSLDDDGIFQFDTTPMRMLMTKFKVDCFLDIVASVALVRPGPRKYAEQFIRRKKGLEKVEYLHSDLIVILQDTYGIILYQEQIMNILSKIGGYSLKESDIIRRAISKKNELIINSEKEKFVKRAKHRGYEENIAIKIYDQISLFAEFGFNKSHSVAYALIAYQMAYLKTYYRSYFILELLNNSRDKKSQNRYIVDLKKHNYQLIKPSILTNNEEYVIEGQKIIMPLNVIKGINLEIGKKISLANIEGFSDYFEFVIKTKEFLTKELLSILIYAGALDCFDINKATLLNNIDLVYNYASLYIPNSSLIPKPSLKNYPELSNEELRKKEFELYGFYISNHPSSKFQDKYIMKIEEMESKLYQKVRCVILVEEIKVIKTKKNEEMAFIKASDETMVGEFTVFPRQFYQLQNIKPNDLIIIKGEVTKRFDKLQIIINNIEKKVS